MKDYFNEVFEILDDMTDEDFDKLLIESGIKSCPLNIESEVRE